MQIKILDPESQLFGQKVLRISELEDVGELINKHGQILEKYDPAFIYCSVDAGDIGSIQKLEGFGYGFSEFRIHAYLQLQESPSPGRMFPFELQLIGEESHLMKVKEILQTSSPDDRFFNDPLIEKEIAWQRELIHIEKSFSSWPGEFILGLFNMQSGKLVAFRSGAFKNEKEVTFYLYGVTPGMDKDHYSRMLDHLVIDFLFDRGVRIIHSVSTGFNTPELNRLILHHGFKIDTAEVVLRYLVIVDR